MALADRNSATGEPSAAPAETPAAGFDFALPADRIAQQPARERDGARLLVVPREAAEPLSDSTIRDLPRWLRRGDLLVVNRSRVIPARLHGRRLPGGGALELLLIAPLASSDGLVEEGRGIASDPSVARESPRWRALARPTRRLRAGQRIALEGRRTADAREEEGPLASVEAMVEAVGDGVVDVRFPPHTDVLALAARIGETPLPPYIRRPAGPTPEDALRYQTVYAVESGSIAAPTAGLHLSEAVLAKIRESGVAIAEIVLHVGPATFLAGQPGRAALTVEPERYSIPPATRDAIDAVRGKGRVVAVGTTTRALESAARAGWPGGMRETCLVLSPGDEFAVIDALLTNFHLPRSSLLALVSAFAGVARTQDAYRAALEQGYRFYSYGDAMLVV